SPPWRSFAPRTLAGPYSRVNRPGQYELPIPHSANGKFVLTDFFEPMALVETLGAVVLRPHADPQPPRPAGFQPCQRVGQQPRPDAAALVGLQQIEPLQLSA